MLEKTEGAIKNAQSRDTGNIVYKRHKTKKQKDEHQEPTKKRGLNPGAREGFSGVLLHHYTYERLT